MKDFAGFSIRPMSAGDWPAVEQIYREGIATGNATFETATPSWDKWNENHLPFARFVATSTPGEVVGWAALNRVSVRNVYSGVAEVSVYVANDFMGRGIGKDLLNHLVQESERNEVWTLQASIFPENVASISIHQKCGFREVGIRHRIGKLDGRWRDTVLLERRSQVVGRG